VGRDPSRHQGSSELRGSALSCCRVCRAPTREDGGQLRFQLIRLRTQRLPRTTPLRAINNPDKRQCSLSTLVFPRMTSANGEPSTFPVSLTRSEPPLVTVPRADLAERCAEDARLEHHRDRHLQSIVSCDVDVLAQRRPLTTPWRAVARLFPARSQVTRPGQQRNDGA
jgi:hypothetical protein